MGNSNSTFLATPDEKFYSTKNNLFISNLIKIDTNDNIESSIIDITNLNSNNNKKKGNFFSKFHRNKKIKNQPTQQQLEIEQTNENSNKSLNKILPEYLILKIIQLASCFVFPSKTFTCMSLVCRLWSKLSIKCIRHLYYEHNYLYESSSDLNYCKLVARWLSPLNHYQTNNKIQAISLKFGIDTYGFCYLVPYLIKCSTLRLLKIEFTNGLLSIERVNTIVQILTLNHHIHVLNISCNSINSKTTTAIGQFFESNKSGINQVIYRKSKLNSFRFATLLEYITKSSKITIINFSDNQIENDHLDTIIHCLSTSSSLETINLSGNLLNSSSIHLIIQACLSNKVTKSLDLRHNKLDLISDKESFFLQYSTKFTNFLI